LIGSKTLKIQYEDDGTTYTIYGYDQPEVVTCTIWQGAVPGTVIAGGYSQAQNDADKSDFQTNYLPTANRSTQRTDMFGNPVHTPLEYAIAFGVLPTGTVASRANGYTAVAATSAKIIRATAYTPQGADGARSINSTSASDIAGGTGMRSVTISYLTSLFVLKSETIVLNGLTAVNTVATDIAYIESIIGVSVGSGGVNAGTIQVWTATGGTGSIWGSIAPSDNMTFWAHHYVPAGKTCFILTTTGSGGLAGATNLLNQDLMVATAPALQKGSSFMHAANNSFDHYYTVPLTIPGGSLIYLTDKPVSSTANTAYGSFDYIQF
jgi:hypothetical protein